MTPLALEHLHRVLRVEPMENGDIHRVPVAKFFLSPDGFSTLEDHMGLLEGVDKMLPADAARRIHRLANSMYFEVRNCQDIQDGHWPEILPEVSPAPEMEAPENKFDVRMKDGKHQSLEWIGDRAFLDGHEIRGQQLQTLLDDSKRGEIQIKRAMIDDEDSEEASVFDDLSKAEKPQLNALQSAMAELKKAAAAGHVHPDVYNSLRREVYQDALTPELGNYRSHQDFLTRPRPGIHVHIDANDFGGINKLHGHHVGNDAIRALGSNIRGAIEETVGKKAKAWRVGGDEFRIHVPTHEHAARFARSLRSRLEKIPAVGGTHQLSVSMGFGHTPEHAESALIDAKGAKTTGGHAPGKAPTYAASRVPGREGLVSQG